MANIQMIEPTMRRPDRLAIRLTLQIKESGRIHSLSGGRIEQNQHHVYWFHGPFGHHISYHDANDNNQSGRIHQRLDSSRGIFQTSPGRKVLGPEAHRYDARAFSDIAGVQAFPPNDMVLTYKSALSTSLTPVKPSKVDDEVVLTLPEHAIGLLGPSLLLIQAGAEATLKSWCNRQTSIWDGEGAVQLDVSVFATLRPSLAIVAGSIS